MTRRKTTLEDKIFDSINYFLLILVTILTIYPFYYIFINSFNEGKDAALGGIYFWPRKFTLENYKTFFSDEKWINAFNITLARTVLGTVITVFFTCLVAYSLSHKNLLFRKFYFSAMVFSMYFSGGIITYYVLLRYIHLLDNFLVYIVPMTIDTFFVLIAVSFFSEIPAELIESAHLDGATEMKIFMRIILPVSMPLIATMLLFVGVGHWNSWLDSAYYVKSDSLRTLAYRMMEIINQSFTPKDQLTAGIMNNSGAQATSLSIQLSAMIIATVPIMCVYPFLQKHFAKGIMLGSVKG